MECNDAALSAFHAWRILALVTATERRRYNAASRDAKCLIAGFHRSPCQDEFSCLDGVLKPREVTRERHVVVLRP
ncbi:MAG: hypothetical protein QOG27_1409, partial [Verrucomicrobiota bacterium]